MNRPFSLMKDRTMCDLTSVESSSRLATHSPSNLNHAGGPAMMIDISQVKSFVSSNLSSVKKTQQVATQLNCSLDKLKKTFYRTERVSLSKYIRESRVCRMKELILTSEAPCKVICLDLGLREDVGARLFKNSTGMTMEEFRKSYFGATPRTWQSERQSRDEDRPGLRLVITENEVRKALTKSSEKEPRRPIPNSSGAWIQGPAH
jgi:AraC-like DNA-binding protein